MQLKIVERSLVSDTIIYDLKVILISCISLILVHFLSCDEFAPDLLLELYIHQLPLQSHPRASNAGSPEGVVYTSFAVAEPS